MSLKDEIKKAIGDEQFKILESKVKIGEFIPVDKFNDKLEMIKGLESEKRLLLEEKTQFEKQLKEKDDSSKTELEKLADGFKALEEKLTAESELRVKSEEALNNEKSMNSIKSELTNPEGEYQLKERYFDLVYPKLKDVPAEERPTKFKEFAENNKELFGKDELQGNKPSGSFEENKSGFYTKDEVDRMSQDQVNDNIDKINESMTKW